MFKKIIDFFSNDNMVQLSQASDLKKIESMIEKSLFQSLEIEWANIFHDSIRGDESISKLSLNIGRWAGNYSFFYVLYRIMKDYKPNTILELGLGESSKLVSTFIKNNLQNCEHIIIEQNQNWINEFRNKFTFNDQTEVIHLPLETQKIEGFDVYKYKDFDKSINKQYELYIIDGPYGSDRFSRFDIIGLVNNFINNEFIILFDDTHRLGEIDTVNQITTILKSKNIIFYQNEYIGNKSVTVIASEKYKHATSF